LGHFFNLDNLACTKIASWQEWKATVHGKGKIKLGIKNFDGLNVQVTDKSIVVELPKIEILSAEPIGVPQVHNEKTGLFSPVKQQDIEKSQNAALDRLRKAAVTDETLAKAKLHAQEVLGKLLQWRFGQKVEFR